MDGLTRQLARFVTTLELRDVPQQAIETAKSGFADCMGVLIAGHREAAPRIVRETMTSADHQQRATVIPSGEKLNAQDAALVNAVAAHVLDYDDVTLDGHPSAVLVPAILAQAEASGATGADMVVAYAAGYEVWAELLMREPIPLYAKGWHPTATRGAVAAAAACAKLTRLDATGTTEALAIAASLAGGLVANFGSMTKSFQVGRAAQSGLIAAKLAKAGLTASPDAIEHPSGFLRAFSPAAEPKAVAPLAREPKNWHLVRQGLNVKRYPLCYGAHRVIDAVLQLAQNHSLSPQDVAQVKVFTARSQMLMMRNERPTSAIEAKFSMPFAVAAALAAGHVGLRELSDDFVRRPDVQSLFEKVSYDLTDETLDDSAFAAADSVTITTTSGETLESEKVVYAKGSHKRPMTREELQAKFDDCARTYLADEARIRLFANLMRLEAIRSASELLAFA
jgi:2-methylcitrate dehydratase PrpD